MRKHVAGFEAYLLSQCVCWKMAWAQMNDVTDMQL